MEPRRSKVGDVPQKEKKQLTVVMVGARGLRNADWSPFSDDKSDPYCICEIPDKPDSKIRTRTIDNNLDPVWNHEAFVQGWEPGDPLKFTVWDKDFGKKDQCLGTVTLFSSHFDREGFNGDMLLNGAGKNRAFVTLRICYGKPMWGKVAVEQAAMAASGFTETQVVSMRTKRRNGRLGILNVNPGLTRQQFRDFLLVERDRVHYCATLPLTIIMTVIFGLMVWGHGNVSSVYRLHSGIHRAVNEIRVPSRLPDGTRRIDVTLDSISNTAEMWKWIGEGLVPKLGGDASRPGFLQSFNKVLGKIQLTQKRVEMEQCKKISPELASYFRLACRSDSVDTDTFGPAPANYTNMTKDSAFVAGGKLEGIGLVLSKEDYFAFLDVVPPELGSERAAFLARSSWCDASTQWVEVRAALFNGEVAAYIDVKVRFEFNEGGLVDKKMEVRPLHQPSWTTFTMLVDIVFIMLMLTLVLVSIQEVMDRKARRKAAKEEEVQEEDDEDEGGGLLSCCNPCARCFGLFLGDFWLTVDWWGLAFGTGLIVVFLLLNGVIDHLGVQFSDLQQVRLFDERPYGNSSVAEHARYDDAFRKYETGMSMIVAELNAAVDWKTYHRIGMFGFTFYLLFRFFRGCLGQPYFAHMIRTLQQAGPDIVHLSMILAITFENFVLSGCLFFGSGLKDWSTVNNSHRAALGLLSGMGDFASMYDKYPAAALVWLFFFAVVIVFIANNMLFAIMVDHFAEVKLECGQARQSLPAQALYLCQDWVWKGSFRVRNLVRLAQGLVPRLAKITPYLDEEEPRVKRVPYDIMLEALEPAALDEGADPDAVVRSATELFEGKGKKKLNVPAWTKGQPLWAPIQMDVLLACGCDEATALRLLSKANNVCDGRRPNDFPSDMVYHEFTGQMRNVYEGLAGTEDDLRIWLEARRVDCDHLEPRQRKLEALSVEKILPRPAEDEPMLMPQPITSGNERREGMHSAGMSLTWDGPDQNNMLTQ